MEIEIGYNDLHLQSINAVPVGKKMQRISLGIQNQDYPRGDLSDFTFSQFGTIHLVSPLLPEKIITTNYALTEKTRGLLRLMYESCGKDAPKVASRSRKVPGARFYEPLDLDERGVVVPFSGGKDGLHHYYKVLKENHTPHLIHIQNMNLVCTSEEVRYASRPAKWLWQDLEIIHLKNGTPRNGFDTMRFRDMFIVALMIPYNVKFDAKSTIIEGFADQLRGHEELFSGKEENMLTFNQRLEEMGLPVKITWYNMPEWQVIKWLLENREYPALARTNSCFAYPLLKAKSKYRLVWPKFPEFPFYESQCGACFKCYMINMGRIAFGDVIAFCPKGTLQRYIQSADDWLARKIKEKGQYYDDPSLRFLINLAKTKTLSL